MDFNFFSYDIRQQKYLPNLYDFVPNHYEPLNRRSHVNRYKDSFVGVLGSLCVFLEVNSPPPFLVGGECVVELVAG